MDADDLNCRGSPGKRYPFTVGASPRDIGSSKIFKDADDFFRGLKRFHCSGTTWERNRKGTWKRKRKRTRKNPWLPWPPKSSEGSSSYSIWYQIRQGEKSNDDKIMMYVADPSYFQWYNSPNFINIVPSCGDFVCKEPHTNWWYGGLLWDVISIKIWRNMKYKVSEVSIHGAIRVRTNNHFTDYLFKRKKEDAQVFEDPGEVITLSLVGPHKPWVLEGFSCEPGVTLYGLLKYNDEDIFPMRPDHPPEHYISYLKGCPESYRDVHNWGDFEDCSDLFYDKEDHVDPVGYGWCCVPYISTTGLENNPFSFHNSILDQVASVEVEMALICSGLVARLKVTSSSDLVLYGEISARSCVFENNGVVLFYKTRKKPMRVTSNKLIPLSRSMAAVDCGASLVIKFYVEDANDSNFLVDETMQFTVLPKGRVSQKTTSNGVFSVEVEWIFEQYGGPSFRFP